MAVDYPRSWPICCFIRKLELALCVLWGFIRTWNLFPDEWSSLCAKGDLSVLHIHALSQGLASFLSEVSKHFTYRDQGT